MIKGKKYKLTFDAYADEEREIDLIRLWSSVHGLAAIACMSGVEVSFDWEDKILGDILIK